MKTRILMMTAAAATALGTTAMAGSLDTTVVEATPVVPVQVPAVVPANTWTGGYLGLSLGAAKGEIGGSDTTEPVYGLHGGYDYQFNNGLVAGGEIEYQGNDDLTVGGVDVDNVSRAKAKLGYDLGNMMVYGTAGVSKVNTSLGDATAPVYGVGAEYKVTERFGIGAEYLNENFKNLGATNTDLQQDTLNLRGTLRF
ncbi:outer membrane protein [Sagittula sp. S175]|uniref:outer membrane protein n=1 Tax=Sagittula sp. S175 TaxID=3415129 RepID=UPI003C7AE930